MSKIFQVVDGFCHWQTPFKSIAETLHFPKDCTFVEAPDYVTEQWGFDSTKEGLDRFIHPTPPEGWGYDEETGSFYNLSEVPRMMEEAKNSKQNENKNKLAEFLKNHPLTWTDGKQYGVTMEDQSEIQLNISQYQIQCQAQAAGADVTPVLEWHAIHEACVPWTIDDLTALVLAISDFVYPWFQKMNEYKAQIFACTDRKELSNMVLDYRTDEEKAAEEASSEVDQVASEEVTTETTEENVEVTEEVVEQQTEEVIEETPETVTAEEATN